MTNFPPESQNIEYKISWHKDYLKWICGFANVYGGKIHLGMNDADTMRQTFAVLLD